MQPLRQQRSARFQGVENQEARQVRVNMLNDGVRSAVGPQSALALGATLVFHVPQLIAIVYVLATSADEPSCDRPLRVWAALDGVWIAATMMVKCVSPPQQRRGGAHRHRSRPRRGRLAPCGAPAACS